MGYKRPGYLAQIWHVIKWKICRRRFLRQLATATGVPLEVLTGKRPKPLSGRKLEREALREYGISRLPGETDEELHRRCFDKAEEEYANQPDWRQIENE